jgi:hypothetical protein
MKHVKIALVTVVAALAAPAHADITQRDVLGVAIGALIGYQLSKSHSQPQHGQPQPVHQGHRHDHMPATCVLRQVYSAPGQGPIYVQECHGGGRRNY